MSKRKIIPLVIAILFFSCKGKTNTHTKDSFTQDSIAVIAAPTPQDTFKTGKVLELSCHNDNTNTFAIYLPVSYSKTNPLPVIYFFDPHADGATPIIRYKSLADEFNFILAGSNQSKNGMQLQQSLQIAEGMITDIQNRFFIQSGLQFAGGFSGGSKVACAVAANKSSINGLIACSGSYINNGLPFRPSLNIVSIAGERDFNYHEMVRFDKEAGTSHNHIFITTDNTHEWPHVDAMKSAFIFMLMRSMPNQTIPKNEPLIKSSFETEIKKAIALENQNDVYGACMNYKNIIAAFKDLADVDFVVQKITSIEKSSAYKSYREKKQSLDMQEQQLQQYYAEAMQSKDITWWKSEIDKLKKSAELKSDRLWSAYNSRMLGFLGIMCYSYSNKAINANSPLALQILNLYKAVEPDNAEPWFLSAVFAANHNDLNGAKDNLRVSIQKGFSEKQRLNNYPALAPVLIDPDVRSALDTLH